MFVLPDNVQGLTAENHREHHEIIHENISKQYNIVHYGASTSSNDNTEIIQDVIDLACSENGSVYIPYGTFKTTSTLIINNSCRFYGDGTIYYLGNNWAIKIGNVDYPSVNSIASKIKIFGITLIGNETALGGIRCFASARSSIEKIELKVFSNGTGILFEDHNWIYKLDDNIVGGCDIAIHFKTTPPTGTYSGNSVSITNGEISGSRIGILVGSTEQTEPLAPIAATSLNINNVAIELNSNYGVHIIDGRSISINNCYFEDNGNSNLTGHILIGNELGSYPTAVNIRENQMVNNASSGGRCVLINNVNHGYIAENMFYMNRDNNVAVEVLEHTNLKVSHNCIAPNIDTAYSGIVES